MKAFQTAAALVSAFFGCLAELIFLFLVAYAFLFHTTSTDVNLFLLDSKGVGLTKIGNLLGFYPSAFFLSGFFPHSSYPMNDWFGAARICFVPQAIIWGLIIYVLFIGTRKLLKPNKRS